jgi:hypothetical protein
MTINIVDSAYHIPPRKRALSEGLQDTHEDKRLRHAESHTSRIREAEARFEDAAAEGLLFLQEKKWGDEPLTPHQLLLKEIDPGYDSVYDHAYQHKKTTSVVDEAASSLICDSPCQALAHFKTSEKKYRRRIKHVAFSVKAVAFGPSRNGNHWKGFCNYIQNHTCIETVTIPVPYDPYPAIHSMISDDGSPSEAEEGKFLFAFVSRGFHSIPRPPY